MVVDPSTGVRVFSIEEANALVPKLAPMVGKQIAIGEDIQRLVTELYEQVGSSSSPSDGAELVDVTVREDDSPLVQDLKTSLASKAQDYRDGWIEVQELGAVVKDTNTGLLDFYGKIDDKLVWLCWKYGEDSIDYYHDLDAGFAGRKPLADVVKRMLN